jgi:YggT family protein
VDIVLQVVIVLLYLMMIMLIARVVIDLVQVFARDYRPRGFALVFFEAVYSVTDPPIRALRRVIPPLRFGGVALDLAVLVLFIGIQVLLVIVQSLRF